MATAERIAPAGSHDFDFLEGRWRVRNRFLRERLAGSRLWFEFDACHSQQTVMGGLGNIERFSADRDGRRVEATNVRLYDPATGEWSIHWADNQHPGKFHPPMVGCFRDGVGEFFGTDWLRGKEVPCRFRIFNTAEGPHWEQAFSADGGKTWETNWIMTFTRVEDEEPKRELSIVSRLRPVHLWL